MNQQAAKKFFEEEHKIRYVLAQFVDIHGRPRRPKGPCRSSIWRWSSTDGAGFAGFALWGIRHGPPKVPTTWRSAISRPLQDIPWMPGYARHRVQWGGQQENPMPSAPGVALQAQIARLTERGAHPVHRHRTGVHAAVPARGMGASGPARLHRRSRQALLRLQGVFTASREVLDEMVAGLRGRGQSTCIRSITRTGNGPV